MSNTEYMPILEDIVKGKDSDLSNRGIFTADINGRTFYLKNALDVHAHYIRVLGKFPQFAHLNLDDYLSKLDVSLAKAMARFYQDLVDVGVYPPGTRFVVCESEYDGKRYPTFMAITPKGDKVKSDDNGDSFLGASERCQQKLRELGLENEDIFVDLILPQNYKRYDGKVYYTDLHVFDDEKHLFLMPDRLKGKIKSP